jgi:hypothetical protein
MKNFNDISDEYLIKFTIKFINECTDRAIKLLDWEQLYSEE